MLRSNDIQSTHSVKSIGIIVTIAIFKSSSVDVFFFMWQRRFFLRFFFFASTIPFNKTNQTEQRYYHLAYTKSIDEIIFRSLSLFLLLEWLDL